jgi:hypothetical protein
LPRTISKRMYWRTLICFSPLWGGLDIALLMSYSGQSVPAAWVRSGISSSPRWECISPWLGLSFEASSCFRRRLRISWIDCAAR